MGLGIGIALSSIATPDAGGGIILPGVTTTPVPIGDWLSGEVLALDQAPEATYDGAASPVTQVEYQFQTASGVSPWTPATGLIVPDVANGTQATLYLRVQVQAAVNLWSAPLSFATASVVSADMPQTLTLTTRNADFTLLSAGASNTYGDGSPWVLANAATQLTAAAPFATTQTGQIGTNTYVDAALNGLMRDPGQAPTPLAPLATRQQDNH